MTAVLLVSGSLQAASANTAALDVITARLVARGVDTVEVADELATIPAFNPDRTDDHDPAVASFRARIARADVVIIASPEYAGAPPGALKNALDWIVGSAELYRKPVALVSAGTSGGVHARAHLTQSLTWQGAHVIADLGIEAPRTKTDGAGRFTDRATLDALEALADLAIEAPGHADEQRVATVRSVVEAAGIDPRHIAPPA